MRKSRRKARTHRDEWETETTPRETNFLCRIFLWRMTTIDSSGTPKTAQRVMARDPKDPKHTFCEHFGGPPNDRSVKLCSKRYQALHPVKDADIYAALSICERPGTLELFFADI